jgi:hypothetical protein
VGVDLVVLGLPPVDRLHRQRVAEDEGDAVGRAEIGEPVPGEHALDGDDEIVAVRGDRLQERLGRHLHVAVQEHLAGGVEQADVHSLHVEIDSAVGPMQSVVESHTLSACVAVRIDPATEPTLTSNRRRAE